MHLATAGTVVPVGGCLLPAGVEKLKADEQAGGQVAKRPFLVKSHAGQDLHDGRAERRERDDGQRERSPCDDPRFGARARKPNTDCDNAEQHAEGRAECLISDFEGIDHGSHLLSGVSVADWHPPEQCITGNPLTHSCSPRTCIAASAGSPITGRGTTDGGGDSERVDQRQRNAAAAGEDLDPVLGVVRGHLNGWPLPKLANHRSSDQRAGNDHRYDPQPPPRVAS